MKFNSRMKKKLILHELGIRCNIYFVHLLMHDYEKTVMNYVERKELKDIMLLLG